MNVVITGGTGLLGSHMRMYLHACTDANVSVLSRETWANHECMVSNLQGADIIFHCAACILGDPEQILAENEAITSRLVHAAQKLDKPPLIAFASSINMMRDDAYGCYKRAAHNAFLKLVHKIDGKYMCFVLPHLFGEGGKPNHNSVISTFCNDVAHEKEPNITHDGTIFPLHAQRAVSDIWSAIVKNIKKVSCVELKGTPMRVSELAMKLKIFHSLYSDGITPDIKQNINLDLFNTYRSYRSLPRNCFYPFVHSDSRGRLVEIIKEKNGGQVFFSVSKPGITRGQHFHRFKMERFVVISGDAEIKMRKIGSEHIDTIQVSGDAPNCVDIPTLHAHNITNIGSSELFTMFWTHEFYDPNQPDTYPENV